MYWEKIDGMFTFQQLYSNMVNKFPINSIFVEIGAFKGKSAVYMVELFKAFNKPMKFYAIDIFEEITPYGDYYTEYLNNIKPVEEYIITLKGDSSSAAKQFKDKSIDFLFIDGDHSYKGVKKNLIAWTPKIKQGGVISGHDYNESTCGVRQAVDEFFTFNAKPYTGGCWYLER